jgi:ABC-type sugar transport system ATPase subunit
VSFDVMPGEFVSLIGPSGCGKSTLFNIIGGLVGDYAGRVTVAGTTVTGTHPSIGMVFQEESTFPWRTVLDNVAFPLEIAGLGKPSAPIGPRTSSSSSACRASSAAIRRSFRAACASASRSRARSPPSPGSC